MDSFLKIISCLMLMVLVTTQLLLTSPYRTRLTNDTLNGRTIKTYETLIYKGVVTLDALGKYTPNTATILINGKPKKTVDAFPVELDVCDGDVIEVQLQLGNPSFYVFLTGQKGQVTTDLKESTVLVQLGVNRIFKVLITN